MKKSLIKKLILMLLVLSLISCIAVACTKKENNDNNDKDDGKKEEVVESDLATKLTEIVKSVNPIINTLNDVEQTSTLSVDASIGLEFDFGQNDEKEDVKGNYNLQLAADLNTTNPVFNLSVNTKDGKDIDRDTTIAFKNNKMYLKQPITQFNATEGGEDEVEMNLYQIKDTVQYLMEAFMYGLSADWQETVKDPKDGTKNISETGKIMLMDFDAIGESIGGILSKLGDVSDLIVLTTDPDTGVSKLTIASKSAKTIVSLVSQSAFTGYKDIINAVVNNLMPEANNQGWDYITGPNFQFPNLFIKANTVDGALNQISLGIDYKDLGIAEKENEFASLDIKLNTFGLDDEAVNPEYPTADIKSFKINANADMIDKGIKANLDAFVTGDMEKRNNTLANGLLTVTNYSGEEEVKGLAQGFFNDAGAYFDLTDAFTALNGADPSTNQKAFQATFKDRKGEDGVNTSVSMYDLLNDSVKAWKEEILKNEPEEPKEAGYTTMQSIYSWLGGDVTKLGINPDRNLAEDEDEEEDEDKEEEDITQPMYNDPSQKDMVEAIVNKFGKYLVPTLEGKTYTSYSGLFNQISGHFKDNADTVKSIFSEAEKWSAVDNDEEWIGSVELYKEGDNNDLLDVVNLFINNVDEEDKPIAYDIDYLTNVVNRYIAVLCISDSSLNNDADVLAYTEAVKDLDNELLFWKNMFKEEHINETVMQEKLNAYYKGLNFESGVPGTDGLTAQYFANLAIKNIFGYVPSDAENMNTDNYIEKFINSGVEAKVFCKKGAGLNGRIEIWNNINSTGKAFFKLGGSVAIVDKDIETGTFILDDSILDLNNIDANEDGTVKITETDEFKVIDKYSDGVIKLVDIAEDVVWADYKAAHSFDAKEIAEGTTYAKLQAEDDEGTALWYNNYVNADQVFEQLWDLLEGYKSVGVN